MTAKDNKEFVSRLFNKEKVATFSNDFNRKLTAFFNAAQNGHEDLVGVDIAPDRLKLLKIDTTYNPPQITYYAEAPLPPDVIVKDEIKNSVAISSALRDLFRQSGVPAKFAAVAIPRALAIIKNIPIDKRFTEDEIESRAWIEANRLFPDLIGNIYLDFTITGPSLSSPDQMDLLLVACRKEHIKPYFEILTQAGLMPKIVDVNCYALERALQSTLLADSTLQTVALLNVNLTQSSLIVVHKQSLIHAHDQTFDGHRLVKQVNDFIAKRHSQQGMEQSPITVNDAEYVALLKENFLSHLRHTIHFFYSSRANISIDQIILSGDCTIIPDFSAFIEKEIGIKTMLADPFQHMEISSRLDANQIKNNSATLMLCSGLALSRAKE